MKHFLLGLFLLFFINSNVNAWDGWACFRDTIDEAAYSSDWRLAAQYSYEKMDSDYNGSKSTISTPTTDPDATTNYFTGVGEFWHDPNNTSYRDGYRCLRQLDIDAPAGEIQPPVTDGTDPDCSAIPDGIRTEFVPSVIFYSAQNTVTPPLDIHDYTTIANDQGNALFSCKQITSSSGVEKSCKLYLEPMIYGSESGQASNGLTATWTSRNPSANPELLTQSVLMKSTPAGGQCSADEMSAVAMQDVDGNPLFGEPQDTVVNPIEVTLKSATTENGVTTEVYDVKTHEPVDYTALNEEFPDDEGTDRGYSIVKETTYNGFTVTAEDYTGADLIMSETPNEDQATQEAYPDAEIIDTVGITDFKVSPPVTHYYNVYSSQSLKDSTISTEKGSVDTRSTDTPTTSDNASFAITGQSTNPSSTGGFNSISQSTGGTGTLTFDTEGLARDSSLTQINATIGESNSTLIEIDSKLSTTNNKLQELIDKDTGLSDTQEADLKRTADNGNTANALLQQIRDNLSSIKDNTANATSTGTTGTGETNVNVTVDCGGSECAKESTQQEIRDSVTGDRAGKEKGSFAEATAEAEAQNEIEKQKLKDKISEIKGEAQEWLTDLNPSNYSGLPTFRLSEKYDVSFNFAEHPEYLNIAGKLMLFIAYFLSFIILISRN